MIVLGKIYIPLRRQKEDYNNINLTVWQLGIGEITSPL